MKNYTQSGLAEVVELGKSRAKIFGQTPDIMSIVTNDELSLARMRIGEAVNDDESITLGQYLSSGGIDYNYDFIGDGIVSENEFLKNYTIPSNITGGFVSASNVTLNKIIVNTGIVSTFDVEVYSHDGNSSNLTLLDTVSLSSSTGNVFIISEPIALNKQIAIKIVNGSGENIMVRDVGQGVI